MAGGQNNTASGVQATVGGGVWDAALGSYATVGGGWGNVASNYLSTIAGGHNNVAMGNSATICGGYANTANGSGAFVGGGGYDGSSYHANAASGAASVVSGGLNNSGGGLYAVVGGGGGNSAAGNYATIPGGAYNLASGAYSFAAGRYAEAQHTGAFVWADSQAPLFSSSVNDSVSFRCQGGVTFTSASGAGNSTVSWAPGNGSWQFSSDRNLKECFATVDTRTLLEKISQLPITEWNYIGYAQRHIGPMAQDWQALFPLNDSDTMLNSADVAGISVAAIQGLNQKLNEKDAEIQALKQSVAELKAMVEKLAGK